MPAKFYVVKAGRKPGIYNSWDECLSQVRGYKGAACQYSAISDKPNTTN